MPTTNIDYTEITQALNTPKDSYVPGDCIISTPFGLLVLEIQGELNLPLSAPQDPASVDPEYLANFATVDDVYHAVKFGRMEFDAKDPSKVVLFIGNSQRLIGSVEKLREPLGVLRVSTNDDQSMKFMDIIEKKVIFKQRPLPIM
ncbi:CIC11C00000004303 [Sungouiella intermedia]|uniref:CIC11C00000004303 n=1 Tax=Sungouiella intermedia TaxID=45354 RepID=A0A1L0DL21_9ASCO|nr:CIC11C00000004303 [[Candida] intermedia]